MRQIFQPPLRIEDLPAEYIRLMQIAFGTDAIKQNAWTEWQSTADFDRMTTGSLLVPAAFHGVADQPSTAVLRRMRGAFNKSWLHANVLREKMAPLLGKIADSGVDCCLGDDFALALVRYPNPGMRPIFEATLYCAPADRPELDSLLGSGPFASTPCNGWRVTDQAILRVRGLAGPRTPGGTCNTNTFAIPVLDPTRQFWCSFLAARPQPLLRVLDIGCLVKYSGEQISWHPIFDRARAEGKQKALYDLAGFLENTLGLELSTEAQGMLGQYSGQAPTNGVAQQAQSIFWNIRNGMQG
ncbi:hypothetical protein [Roseobacter sp. GAI101]|uniref:hypothetical protein n=1 Tax=Roseobacter sp. (strain GAI101) TaxID=391589 RepID=UPI00055D6A12|nr:hypothetical protein [Roseobacter sp. GAI101]